MKDTLNIAFIGNPNCGKTTLFNAYTGARLKTANWPGVTVEKKEGCFKYHGNLYNLIDLPGLYSLTSYTMEEQVTRKFILDNQADVIIDIADASALERNLYLTLQLIEMNKPLILALNMMDVVEERGMEIDLHRLQEMLGIPAIPISARKKRGLDTLIHEAAHHHSHPPGKTEHHHPRGNHPHDHHDEYVMVYSDDIEDKIDLIIQRFKVKYPQINGNHRWYAIKMLEQDQVIRQQYPLELTDIIDRNYESTIVNQRYNFIQEVICECLINKEAKSRFTDRIDNMLTHNIWGMPIFLLIMGLIFFLTFTVGDWLKGYLEIALEWFSGSVSALLEALNVGQLLSSLIIDGVIAGVGGILTFLPNIFILFLALALMEDSGYIARVAYVMDGIMSKIGLSGRAFIPMILGFGCTVPAIMATRTLEHHSDRLKAIMITPFMSCSARLPIYVLLSSIFFGKFAMVAAYSMYLLGLITAIVVALIMDRLQKQKMLNNSLLIELPEYKAPNLRSVLIYVWEKIKSYLIKAGTVILAASIVLWFLLNLGPNGFTTDVSQSLGAMLGKFLTPVMSTAGLGQWQIVVALISGIAAKEVVVTSLAVLYNITNISSAAGMTGLASILATTGFTALNAYCLMIFCLLYIPCAATLGVIKQEAGSVRWMIIAACVQLGIAWLVATVVFQIGSLLF